MVTTSTWSTPNRTEKMMKEIRQEIWNVAPEVAVTVRNASGKSSITAYYYARYEVPSARPVRRVIVVNPNCEVPPQREEKPVKEGKSTKLHPMIQFADSRKNQPSPLPVFSAGGFGRLFGSSWPRAHAEGLVHSMMAVLWL